MCEEFWYNFDNDIVKVTCNISHKEMTVWNYYDENNFGIDKGKKGLTDLAEYYEIPQSDWILPWKTETYNVPIYIDYKKCTEFVLTYENSVFDFEDNLALFC